VSGQGGSPGWGAPVGGLWRPRGRAEGVRRRIAGRGGKGVRRRRGSSRGTAARRGGLASLDHSEAHTRVGEAGQMLEQRVHDEQSFAGEEMGRRRRCAGIETRSGPFIAQRGMDEREEGPGHGSGRRRG